MGTQEHERIPINELKVFGSSRLISYFNILKIGLVIESEKLMVECSLLKHT